MAPIKVCVVGLGRAGRIHALNAFGRADPTLVRLGAVVDPLEGRAEGFVAEIHAVGDVKPFHDLESALKANGDDKKIFQAVVVASPTAQHVATIKLALKAGLPVMCEKPVSFAVEEIDECYKLAEEVKLPLLCAYQRRHDLSFRGVAEGALDGSIGTVQIVRSTSRDNPFPTVDYLKISGKVFHDCASHDIDLVRWVAGCNPVSVYATGHAFNKDVASFNDWDTITISLKFPNGVLGTIDVSRLAVYGYDQRLEVHGSNGMLTAQNQPSTSLLKSTSIGHTVAPNLYSFPQRYKETYAEELRHFIRIVRDGEKPAISHEDARAVAIIADAAEKSCETGQVVIPDFSMP